MNAIFADRESHSAQCSDGSKEHDKMKGFKNVPGHGLKKINNDLFFRIPAQENAKENGEKKYLDSQVIFQKLPPTKMCRTFGVFGYVSTGYFISYYAFTRLNK